MASYDRTAFAYHVAAQLRRLGLSGEAAAHDWPETNAALWSRVKNGHEISVGNFLLVCKLLRLPPFRYLVREKARRVTLKSIVKQTLTAPVSRGTADVP